MSVEGEVNVNISAFILCVHCFKQNQQNKKNHEIWIKQFRY